VIHRDLKPENVLILPHAAARGQIKILDFGLAGISQLDPWLTVPSQFLERTEFGADTADCCGAL
jgi:serine/threonine protein kinase